jgi:hypothetical protein
LLRELDEAGFVAERICGQTFLGSKRLDWRDRQGMPLEYRWVTEEDREDLRTLAASKAVSPRKKANTRGSKSSTPPMSRKRAQKLQEDGLIGKGPSALSKLFKGR